MKKLIWQFYTAAPAYLALCLMGCVATRTPQDAMEHVKFSIEFVDDARFAVVATNTANSPVTYFDSISKDRWGLPGFVVAHFRERGTQVELPPYTWLMNVSSVLVPPMPLSVLKPGEVKRVEYGISGLIFDADLDPEKTYDIKLSGILYLDAALKTRIENSTDWIPLQRAQERKP